MRESNPGSSALEADALTTRPTRVCRGGAERVECSIYHSAVSSLECEGYVSVDEWKLAPIIMIIIIAFHGAIRDFLLQSPHWAANRLQHVRSSGPGTIVCKSRATHRALITCNMSC